MIRSSKNKTPTAGPIHSMKVRGPDFYGVQGQISVSSFELKLEYPDNHFDMLNQEEFFKLVKKYLEMKRLLKAQTILEVIY